MNSSYDEFYDYLNFIGGRYIIVYKKNNDVKVLTDPHALKTLFFHDKTSICASHIELLNKIVDEKIQDTINCTHKNYSYSYELPGNYTKYENIYFLPGNFYFSINTKLFKRFWPSKQRIYGSVFDARTKILNKYYLQIKNLQQRFKIVMSLTGGKDSRVSLFSANNLMKNIYFFTESRDNDIKESLYNVKKFNLNWMGVDSKDLHFEFNNFYNKFCNVINKHAYPPTIKFALRCQFFYFLFFGKNNFLHIHSNCAETGRGYSSLWNTYTKKDFCFNKFYTAYIETSLVWCNKDKKDIFRNAMFNDQTLKDILFKYYKKTNLEEIAILGYNPWNILYMENRCSNFMSCIHTLNDIAFDSISLTNTRDILSDFWQIDDEFINQSNILYKSILEELNFYKYTDEFNNFKYHDDFLYQLKDRRIRDLYYSKNALLDFYFSQKKFDKVIEICEKLIDINRLELNIYKYIIKSYIQKKDYQNVYKYCLICIDNIKCDDINKCYFIEEAMNYFRNNKITLEYVNILTNKILEINDSIFWVFKQKAHYLHQIKNFKDATDYVKKAIQLNRFDKWSNDLYIKLICTTNKEKALLYISNLKNNAIKNKIQNIEWIDNLYDYFQNPMV